MALLESRTVKALVLSSGEFLVTLTSLLSAVVLARLFSKQDYAAYRQTLLAYTFVAPLLALGLPKALYYFIPRDQSRARSALTGNLLLLSLTAGLFVIAVWCGGNELLARRFQNPAISTLLLVYSPYALLSVPAGVFSVCMVSCGKVGILAVYQVTSRVLSLACILGLVLLWRAPIAAVGGTVVGELLVFLPALYLMYKVAPGNVWRPRAVNLWEQISYGVPLGMAGMVGIVARNLDKVIVSSMCTPDEFAIYANGAIEVPLIGILTGSITAVLMPDIVRFYKEGRKEAALDLWKRAAVKCSMILLPAMCFLFVMAPEVMRVLFSAKYAESATPFRIYLLLLPIRIVTWGTMLMAAGRSSWVLYRTVVSLGVNLVLSILLVRYIGYVGAAVGTVCEFYLWATPFYAGAISRLYGCPLRKVLPYRQLFSVFAIALVATPLCMMKRYLPVYGDFLKVAMLAPVYAAVVVALLTRFEMLDRNAIVTSLRGIVPH